MINSGQHAGAQLTCPAKANAARPSMHYRALGVGGSALWFRDEFTETPHCTWQWTEWGGALEDQLHKALPDLVLLNAVPTCPAVGEFLRIW